MFIFAYVVGAYGSWDDLFDPGLKPAATIHRNSSAAAIDAVLSRVERGQADILSLHGSRLKSLSQSDLDRLKKIWADRGINATELLAEMQASS